MEVSQTGIEGGEAIYVVYGGSVGNSGTHGGEGEVGLMGLDELPCGLFGERLARQIQTDWIIERE